MRNRSIRTKLFMTLGLMVCLSIAYVGVMIYYLDSFIERADAVIVKQKFANIFENLEELDSVLTAIGEAYVETESPTIKKNGDAWRERYEGFAIYARGEALEPSDGERLNKALALREQLFVLEKQAFALQADNKNAEAQAVFNGPKYKEYKHAFSAMLDEGKVVAEKEIAQYVIERDSVLLVVVWLAYLLLFILVFAGGALIYIVSTSIMRTAREVEKAATAIGRGEIGKRIEVRSGDELGKMAIAFNKMAVALDEKARERLKEITKDIGR